MSGPGPCEAEWSTARACPNLADEVVDGIPCCSECASELREADEAQEAAEEWLGPNPGAGAWSPEDERPSDPPGFGLRLGR